MIVFIGGKVTIYIQKADAILKKNFIPSIFYPITSPTIAFNNSSDVRSDSEI